MKNLLLLLTLLSLKAIAQDGSSVIHKYLDASGGKENLQKTQTVLAQLVTYRPGEDSSFIETVEALPNFIFRKNSRKNPMSPTMLSYSNSKGTFLYTRKLKYTHLALQKSEVRIPDLSIPHRIKKLFDNNELIYLNEQRLNHTKYFAFKVPVMRNTVDAYDVYYFHKTSGLLTASHADGDSTIINYYRDYQQIENVRLPFITETVENGTTRFIASMQKVEINLTVDTAIFYPPRLKSLRKEGDFQEIEILPKTFGERSLEELLAHFSGKRILIDIWASWCVPCNAEFSVYDDQFYEFLFFNKVEILFVSVDKPEKEIKWKENIDWFNVNGYHVRAEDKLVQSLRSSIFKGEPNSKNDMFAIPRYILVDEVGNILNSNVPKPSSTDFKNAIELAFKKE